MLGERADRNELGAEALQAPQTFAVDAAGNFDQGAAVDHPCRAGHGVVVEIVEHDHIGPGGKRLLKFGHGFHFDLDPQIACAHARRGHGGRD